MFFTVLLFSLAIMAIVMLALGFRVFFTKDKSFPDSRISRNKEMRKRKIYCAETQQRIIEKKGDTKGCSSCY